MEDIHCPNCGFLQPRDEFCAQCGININNYKKKPSSLWKKEFFFPTLFLLFIFSFISFKFFSSLSTPEQTAIQNQTPPFLSKQQESKNESLFKVSPTAKLNLQKKLMNHQKNLQNLSLTSAKKTELPQKNQEKKTKQAPKVHKAPKKPEKPIQLQVHFFEIPKESLNLLFEKEGFLTENALSLKQDSSFLFNWLNEVNAIRLQIEPTPKFTLTHNQSIILEFTEESFRDENSILGLKIQILFSKSNKSNEKNWNSIEMSSENYFEETDDFETYFQWPNKENRIFLKVVDLPRRKLKEQESSLSHSPLNIMNSASFLENETDMVMILTLNSSSKSSEEEN